MGHYVGDLAVPTNRRLLLLLRHHDLETNKEFHTIFGLLFCCSRVLGPSSLIVFMADFHPPPILLLFCLCLGHTSSIDLNILRLLLHLLLLFFH